MSDTIQRSWLKDALDRALGNDNKATAVAQFVINLARLKEAA